MKPNEGPAIVEHWPGTVVGAVEREGLHVTVVSLSTWPRLFPAGHFAFPETFVSKNSRIGVGSPTVSTTL